MIGAVVLVLVGLAGAAALLAGVRWHRHRQRSAWFVLAGAVVAIAVADALSRLALERPDRTAYALGATLLSVLGALGAGTGTLWLGRRGDRSGERIALLCSAAVAISIGLLGWATLAGPMTAVAAIPSSSALLWATLAGDALLVAGLAGLGPSRALRRTALVALLLAAASRWAAHLVLVLAPGADGGTGRLGMLLLLTSYVGWGTAGLVRPAAPSSRGRAGAGRSPGRLYMGAVVSVLLVPTAALVIERTTGSRLALWPVAAAAVVLLAVVVARGAETLDQIKAGARDRRQAKDELAYQAAHDSLTGLPNRAESLRLIRAGLSRTQRSRHAVGLLFVDLDGFKAINDSLGHRAGDEVLRHVADRMRAGVRAGDVVGRLGGDEFVVLLEPLDTEASAVATAERLVQAIGTPVALSDGRQVGIGASVGVAISQNGGTDPDVLLHEADVAVYRAKQTGRGRTEVFDQRLRHELNERTEIEAGIVRAIRDDELVVHYQPIVHVETGEVLGYEALVRWRRPNGKLVAPVEFILVAEQSDLICDLDSWVLDRATRQLAAWNERIGRSTLFMAVNMSGRHIIRPRLLDDVAKALQSSGIEPRQLVLEITETALIDDSLALTNLEALRRNGVSISIDDFGSGYNSIARLEQLPVDIVKVDSRFLSRGGPSTNKLLKLIVQAAHAFGLPVVAEGVEHQFELDMLRSIECESAQGYHLGRPADPAEIVIEDVVRSHVASGAG